MCFGADKIGPTSNYFACSTFETRQPTEITQTPTTNVRSIEVLLDDSPFVLKIVHRWFAMLQNQIVSLAIRNSSCESLSAQSFWGPSLWTFIAFDSFAREEYLWFDASASSRNWIKAETKRFSSGRIVIDENGGVEVESSIECDLVLDRPSQFSPVEKVFRLSVGSFANVGIACKANNGPEAFMKIHRFAFISIFHLLNSFSEKHSIRAAVLRRTCERMTVYERTNDVACNWIEANVYLRFAHHDGKSPTTSWTSRTTPNTIQSRKAAPNQL